MGKEEKTFVLFFLIYFLFQTNKFSPTRQLVSNPEHATIKYTIREMMKKEGLAGFTGEFGQELSHTAQKVAIITSLYECVHFWREIVPRTERRGAGEGV